MPIAFVRESSPMRIEVYEGTYDEPGEMVCRLPLPPDMRGRNGEWTVYGADRPGGPPEETCRCRMGERGSEWEIALEF